MFCSLELPGWIYPSSTASGGWCLLFQLASCSPLPAAANPFSVFYAPVIDQTVSGDGVRDSRAGATAAIALGDPMSSGTTDAGREQHKHLVGGQSFSIIPAVTSLSYWLLAFLLAFPAYHY